MYVSMTEKCLCCGGEVGIGMPCGQPCKAYPVITTTTSSTGLYQMIYRNGKLIKDDYNPLNDGYDPVVQGSGLCMETAGEG